MKSRLLLFVLSLYLAFAVLGCSKQSTSDNSNPQGAADNEASPNTSAAPDQQAKEHKRNEVKREPLVVPAGTTVTVSLGSALGSKLSQDGQTFNGSVAKEVMVGNTVAIPKGADVSGTVVDAKPLGKLAGGAVLQVRLDSIRLHGTEIAVQSDPRTFTAKGKGKRTAVATGGGAALGGIIGALAGGGKGAAIGLAAGAGAGAGGAAFTGNKDIVLPAESDVSFQLSQALEVRP
jgi:hypothetical protein